MAELPQRFSGENLQEVLAEAAESLSCEVEELEYKVIQREKKGLLRRTPCVIEVSGQHKKNDNTNTGDNNGIVAETAASNDPAEEKLNVSIDGYYEISEEDNAIYLVVYPPENRGNYVKWKDVKSKLEEKGFEILDEAFIVEIVRKSEGQKVDISEYIEEHVIDGSFEIRVAEDNMKALLKVNLPQGRGKEVNLEEITQALSERKISQNLDFQAIHKCVSEGTQGEFRTIATGDQPIDGKDAEIQLHFEEKERKPVVKEDGSVDYYNIDNVTNVKAEDLLASKHPPEEGSPGKDVYGNIVSPKPGTDRQIKRGKNTELSEDEMELRASIDGQVVMNNDGFIHVYPVYEVSGDVDVSTGNIDFVGNVIVKGQIKSGLKVKAAGDVEVRKSVDSCIIEAGGNVDIKGGIQGRNKGSITAGGSVTCKFIENAQVSAEGDINVIEGILHSQVEGNKINVFEGKKGLLVGGKVTAREEVVAKMIGSSFATATHVAVGLDPELRKKSSDIDTELKNTNENLEKTDKAIAILQKVKQTKGALPKDKENMLVRLQRTKSHLDQTKQQLCSQKEEIKNILKDKTDGRVIAKKVVYPGVKVTIGEVSYNIKDEQKSSMFRLSSDGEVSSEPVS
ncbi:FapA family protein [Natranaerobius thermophilus]|uniref:RNA-binding protein KhpB N-terminal domain-containing protein n=1 Tax=Natranaerobius thermophilus (strain ATCC BAA-1301 / DSM 18059 / JW/NM-WN-LF) TaxID=457570 RepID=B2A376_NATTJ|nr:FapA family protein [Natranaerobius thermophilus]ACB85006.1 protein of unknown function DUF342 [Natranaerobius thermophilus JW/NM-WN-LF]